MSTHEMMALTRGEASDRRQNAATGASAGRDSEART
jgi:hypothetical protein